MPSTKVFDWIPYNRSKWRSRPEWSEVYRHRALLTDAFVASRGFLLTQSDVTAACFRVANNRHLTARTEDTEHCAYRLRCMMSQLRSARVDKISPPSKYDLLRGVMMMAHITAPPSQWQRSNSKKTDASWEDETEDSHEINDIAFDARTPSPEKLSCSVRTVSDEELDEVTVVSDSRFDTEEKLDALMRNLFVSVTSSEVVPGELVAVVNDSIIDYNKIDGETDGEVVVGPTAQGYKQQFSHAKAKPKAESSNRTASGAVNRPGSVCPLEKRAGKTKSGVSTPMKTKRGSSGVKTKKGSSGVSTSVKTKKGSSGVSTPVKTNNGSSKKQDTPSSRANATTLWTQVTANEFTAEVITERGRAGRIAGSTSLRPLAKRPRSPLGKKSWPTRSTLKTNQILRMRSDGEIFVRRL